ncbi:hypothetical protein J0X19_22455 [Hymenobacter sp. BT186]|uniref:Uncharacterized protein n=1 Tax=Hymenobacter telluris TaxID=2816474 RepID=A0A939F271_9BACT|nr:hypothetical protein [Hymenobacter telluris]MBO0360740.1 hypothetical protein [Hymenobacter telluris]MBW3376768.1 hypothetical protein [Hymenobacter norwichensis]
MKLLGNVGAPVGKVKLKNVGNTDTDTTTTVQHGITSAQLTLVAVLLSVMGLLCWLKPWK